MTGWPDFLNCEYISGRGGEGGGNWLANLLHMTYELELKCRTFAVRLAKEVADFNTLYEGLNSNKMATLVYFKKYKIAFASLPF